MAEYQEVLGIKSLLALAQGSCQYKEFKEEFI